MEGSSRITLARKTRAEIKLREGGQLCKRLPYPIQRSVWDEASMVENENENENELGRSVMFYRVDCACVAHVGDGGCMCMQGR